MIAICRCDVGLRQQDHVRICGAGVSRYSEDEELSAVLRDDGDERRVNWSRTFLLLDRRRELAQSTARVHANGG